MKRITSALIFLLSTAVFGATTNPVQLLNPAGSTAGQAVVSTGPSSAPAWGNVTAPSITGSFPTVSITPTASTLNKALNTSQSVAGTTSANCTTTTLIMYPCVNLFYISSDTADASSAPGPVMDGWQFAHNFGGSTMNGGRQILDVIGHFTAPSNPANPLPGYVAITGELITNSGDNGTAPTLVGGRGSFFAFNPVVVANSGAQNLFGIAGEEVNVQCNGCSTAIRFGTSVVNNGANQGSILGNDAAFHLGSFNSGGAWHQALNLSSIHGGPPLDTTGCVICTDATPITIGTGIDLSAYTISGNFLKGPGGFQVTGAAALTASGGSFGAGGVGSSGGLNVTAGGASITGGLTVATGAIVPVQTTGITGTTTNNNASAGAVGEYLTNTTSGTSLTSNTPANSTSVSLTAGDWDVSGTAQFVAGTGATGTSFIAGANTVSATLAGFPNSSTLQFSASATALSQAIVIPTQRISLSSTTTVYLPVQAIFSGGTMTVNGFIRARRVR